MKYITLVFSFLFLTCIDVLADHEPLPGVITFSRMDNRLLGVATNDIFVMNLDGTEIRRLTTANSSNSDSIDPDFSPDGSKIVFASHRSNNPSKFTDIYIMDTWDLDSSGQGDSCKRLTNSGPSSMDSAAPKFSPDGSKVVFHRFDDSTSSADIFVMNSDGTNIENITNNSNTEDYYPSWSTDGSKIAFARDRALYTVDTASPHHTEAVLLTPLPIHGLHWNQNDEVLVSAVDVVISLKKLFVVDMTSPFPTALEITSPSITGDSFPHGSPSASHILFSRTTGPGDASTLPLDNMYVSHSDGTSPVPVVLGATSDFAGSWTAITNQESPVQDVDCEYSP